MNITSEQNYGDLHTFMSAEEENIDINLKQNILQLLQLDARSNNVQFLATIIPHRNLIVEKATATKKFLQGVGIDLSVELKYCFESRSIMDKLSQGKN